MCETCADLSTPGWGPAVAWLGKEPCLEGQVPSAPWARPDMTSPGPILNIFCSEPSSQDA